MKFKLPHGVIASSSSASASLQNLPQKDQVTAAQPEATCQVSQTYKYKFGQYSVLQVNMQDFEMMVALLLENCSFVNNQLSNSDHPLFIPVMSLFDSFIRLLPCIKLYQAVIKFVTKTSKETSR